MDSFQIVQRSRYQFLYWWFLFAILLVVAYFSGVYQGENKERNSNINKQQLNQQLSEQKFEISQLIEDKVVLKQKLSLEQRTLAVLESNYKLLNKENENLKEDIKFYQRIMNPLEKNLELAIHKIHLYPLIKSNEPDWLKDITEDETNKVYKLDTLLVNYAVSKKILKGQFEFELVDSNKNKISIKKWHDNKGKILTRIPIRFKYYQQNHYFIVIDSKYKIEQLIVKIKLTNSKNKIENLVIKMNDSKEIRYVGQ